MRRPSRALPFVVALAWPLALCAQPVPADSSPIPSGTLDPRAPVKPLEHAMRELHDDRLGAPALERYAAGDYGQAAALGLDALRRGAGSLGLRYAVANSLAWTGRYEHAIAQYRALFGTSFDARARIGVANVLRWRGQADLAEPFYLEALGREPASEDAAGGLALAARELRPALTLRGARTADNQDVERDEISLSYRHWSRDRRWRFEAAALRGRQRSPQGSWSPHGLQASLWALALPLAPQVEAAHYDGGVRGGRWFGGVQLEPVRDRLRFRAGRVNWARLAFSPGAALADLTADALGAYAESELGIGALRGRLDLYDISDGNRIVEGEAQLTPAWQPLASRLIWFGGLYGREARREDPRYWSPRPAYALAFLGVRRSWSFERGDLSVSVRRGFALSATAGDSWSAGLTGRHWLRSDLAIGLEAWAVDTPRPEPYRMHHASAFVQHLW